MIGRQIKTLIFWSSFIIIFKIWKAPIEDMERFTQLHGEFFWTEEIIE